MSSSLSKSSLSYHGIILIICTLWNIGNKFILTEQQNIWLCSCLSHYTEFGFHGNMWKSQWGQILRSMSVELITKKWLVCSTCTWHCWHKTRSWIYPVLMLPQVFKFRSVDIFIFCNCHDNVLITPVSVCCHMMCIDICMTVFSVRMNS